MAPETRVLGYEQLTPVWASRSRAGLVAQQPRSRHRPGTGTAGQVANGQTHRSGPIRAAKRHLPRGAQGQLHRPKGMRPGQTAKPNLTGLYAELSTCRSAGAGPAVPGTAGTDLTTDGNNSRSWFFTVANSPRP